MKYTKIKITSKDNAKRFYRILCVNGNPDLNELGALIGLSINCWFEHGYLFNADGIDYIPGIWSEDAYDDEVYILDDYHLDELGDHFTYEYDTGEGWDFDCKVMKTTYDYEPEDGYDYPLAMVIEGKGQGIFENDHTTFWRYLNGEIDPESSEEDEDEMQFLPMNMEFEKFGDFDEPLDLEDMFYYEEDIEEIVDQMGGDYRESNYSNALSNIEMMVSYDIFHEETLNKTFKRLIKKYDVDYAYEKILDAMIEISSCYKESMTDEEIKDMYLKGLKKLK